MFNSSRFPEDVLLPSALYVYFMSLLKTEDGKHIVNTISPTLNAGLSTQLRGGTKSIDDAFSFLDTVIQSEYAKERNFLEYLKNKTKTLLHFNAPTLDSDWADFIKEILENLGAGENAILAMKNELARLEKLDERRGTKKNINGPYELDQISKLTEYANMLNNYIGNRQLKDFTKELSSKIYGLILSKYGSRLIAVDNNGHAIFNPSQLLGLMNTISSIILHDYIIKNSIDEHGYKQFNDNIKDFDINKLEQSLDSSAIESRIDNILKYAEALPFYTNDLANSLGLFKDTSGEMFNQLQYSLLSSILKDINKYGYDLAEIGTVFHDLYNNYTVPESAFKITSNSNIYSETASMINAEARGAFLSSGTGASGAKPDSIWSFITINIDELLSLKQTDEKKYHYALTRLEKIHSELLKLSNEMKSTNNEKYYKQLLWRWNLSITIIHKNLEELENECQLLGNCYIIEDSTKNYISLYGKTINNKLSDSMHGGSLGPNVTDLINKISSLAQIGGISFPDAKWLISVIINSGPNMIAQEQKNKLEGYLAAFATILLFDDQINIVKEAYRDMINSLSATSGSVEKIHLFSVNDGYYPLSYVLRLTRQALLKNYAEALQYITNTPSGGAEVTIDGYVKEPQEAYKNRKAANQWDATRIAALNETKIHITFLVGFMGVLLKLFPSID